MINKPSIALVLASGLLALALSGAQAAVTVNIVPLLASALGVAGMWRWRQRTG